MDTSIERIRAKIAEMEAKLSNLRIAERELLALETAPAPRTKAAPRLKPKRKPKANRPSPARQTIGAAIAQVLGEHGALPVAEIAGQIKAAGRDIGKRLPFASSDEEARPRQKRERQMDAIEGPRQASRRLMPRTTGRSPVSVPSTEVAMRLPRFVVAISRSVSRFL